MNEPRTETAKRLMKEFGEPGGAWFRSAMTDAVRHAVFAIEQEAAALDPERLARAIPEDAVAPYSDWAADNLARHIATEYERLSRE